MPDTDNNNEKTSNPKVELLISRNASGKEDTEAGIDLVSLFSHLKNLRAKYVRITAALILIGVAAALLAVMLTPAHPSVRAVLTFNYEGAENGEAPDGTLLETDALKSTYIISSALSSVTLSKDLSAASVAANLSAERVLSDESKKELQALSGLDPKSNAYFEGVKALKLVYTNRMTVTLKNGFSMGKKTLYISDKELMVLTERIIDAFRKWMVTEYSALSRPETFLDTGKELGTDYLDQLDRINSFLETVSSYASARAKAFPDFRSSANGLSFGDVKAMIDRELSIETEHTYAHVYLNSISVDPELVKTNLRFRLSQLSLDREEKLSRIAAVETSIENFKKEQIDIIRKEGEEALSTLLSSDYYNSLIIKNTALRRELSQLDRNIRQTEDRLAAFESAGSVRQADKEAVEKRLDDAYSGCVAAANILYDLNEELIASGSFNSAMTGSVSALEVDQGKTLKALAAGAAAGAAVGLILWFGNALVLELRHSPAGKEEN